MDGMPLTFSFDTGLDAALTKGWAGWIETARAKGIERTAEWLLRREETGLDLSDLASIVPWPPQSWPS